MRNSAVHAPRATVFLQRTAIIPQDVSHRASIQLIYISVRASETEAHVLRLSKEALASRIRKLARRHTPLDAATISRTDPSLLRFARMSYGRVGFWRKALEAAGVKYIRPMHLRY